MLTKLRQNFKAFYAGYEQGLRKIEPNDGQKRESFILAMEKEGDDIFGINYQSSEANIEGFSYDNEVYQNANIGTAALNSSYFDITNILKGISTPISIVDVGAGYCKIGLVNLAMGFNHSYIGYEVALDRIVAANKLFRKFSAEKHQAVCQDIVKCPLTLDSQKWYFLYIPLGQLMASFLKSFLSNPKIDRVKLAVIESHGDVMPFFESVFSVETQNIRKFKLSIPRHDPYLYCFEIRKPSFPKINNGGFWQAFLLQKTKLVVCTINKQGRERRDLLGDCEVSFYRGQAYLILPGEVSAAFADNSPFSYKFVRLEPHD